MENDSSGGNLDRKRGSHASLQHFAFRIEQNTVPRRIVILPFVVFVYKTDIGLRSYSLAASLLLLLISYAHPTPFNIISCCSIVMVKLASVREFKLYGPHFLRNAYESFNSSLYFMATVFLLGGFVIQLPFFGTQMGFLIEMLGLFFVLVVNVHDLFAHLAGIGFNLRLVRFDWQLGLVEFTVPLVQAVGTILFFVGTLSLFLEVTHDGELQGRHWNHALNLLVAGPALWVCGSILNAFEVYERTYATLQVMQRAVYVPFLIGSILYLIGGIVDIEKRPSGGSPGRQVWSIWLGISGSCNLLIGGGVNLVKVITEQEGNGEVEILRVAALERPVLRGPGHTPLLEDLRVNAEIGGSQSSPTVS